ncbi:MAG: hypothetical protein GXY57_04535 [Erysipelotrichaceae bacterium]|jgi:hypothetical protein|nr:hypothetical protein [Bacilli bacterium]NLV29398.1 hypothetical protein [Erysipelotrichaceae bacterium]HPY80014.1 hypothetical protein [Bacilli bacterium]HQA56104.1 hypothetical protein [Bacilli bacterium]
MSRSKAVIISLILLSIVFILSLTNIILNVVEGLPYPLYETIFCGLVLLGIILPFIPRFAEFDRYPRIFLPLLGFLLSSAFYGVTGIQQGGGFNIAIGILDFVMACVIVSSLVFMIRKENSDRSRLYSYIALASIAVLSLTIVILSVINFAREDTLSAVRSVGLVSLLFAGLAIPGSTYLTIRK